MIIYTDQYMYIFQNKGLYQQYSDSLGINTGLYICMVNTIQQYIIPHVDVIKNEL